MYKLKAVGYEDVASPWVVSNDDSLKYLVPHLNVLQLFGKYIESCKPEVVGVSYGYLLGV